ncbi:hypothetical protein L2735_04130 [Shewanella olleyana]|uniref:hypothetical protein n=1 Tax=Shewanella olleyana TaxID=135626 RepID=UPI00200E384C|nr:hypothetical protein [Shewanella olleyana]MCL1065993.1 hypothetical protein [Shewanella olleyana]
MQILALLLFISAVSVSSLVVANADLISIDSANTSDSANLNSKRSNSNHSNSNSLSAKNSLNEALASHYLPSVASSIVDPSSLVQSLEPSISAFILQPVASKSAVICSISDYEQCLLHLPNEVAIQLPNYVLINSGLGLKSAVVLPVKDEYIAGMIIVNNSLPLTHQIVAINGQTYQLDLSQQSNLTLWHEIGHLENIAQQGIGLPKNLSPYEHEWLADIYLAWRLAHQHNDLVLAWQQLHRRNMAIINHNDNISHWSSPQLLWLLTHYQVEDMVEFEQYSDFVVEVYPQIPSIYAEEMMEISSLIKRTFNHSAMQPLPRYMFWRQSRLIEILRPTLTILMGEEVAEQWLTQQFSEAVTKINAE